MSKILIIEDEEPIRRVLKRILLEENDKFIISEAKDGKEGLTAFLNKQAPAWTSNSNNNN